MVEQNPAKTALFESIAVMGKAFASPRRLELLDLLAQGPRTVDQLAKASKQSTANASQHLQALHAAGLVSREREGNKVRYDLAGEDVTILQWFDRAPWDGKLPGLPEAPEPQG